MRVLIVGDTQITHNRLSGVIGQAVHDSGFNPTEILVSGDSFCGGVIRATELYSMRRKIKLKRLVYPISKPEPHTRDRSHWFEDKNKWTIEQSDAIIWVFNEKCDKPSKTNEIGLFCKKLEDSGKLKQFFYYYK